MKNFLNDADGLSLYDFMALLIIGTFIAITATIFIMILRGHDVSQMLEFYKSFASIPATAAVGIFIQGSAKEIWGKRQVSKAADDTLGKGDGYTYVDGDYSSDSESPI